MEKWALAALTIFGLVVVVLFNWQFVRSFNERVIRDEVLRAANAASDAATEALLQFSETTTTGLIITEPEDIKRIYLYTFLEGLSLNSRENLKEIEHFFQFSWWL